MLKIGTNINKDLRNKNKSEKLKIKKKFLKNGNKSKVIIN